MTGNYKLELITVVAILVFIMTFLFISSSGNHEFSGSDDVGSEKIAELTGNPVESYSPLIPQYEPPSGEIEATLFALQAAVGGLILGIVFGFWLGQRKSSSAT
jgi:cobalt/nickel transport protein